MDELPSAKKAIRERVLLERAGLSLADRTNKSALICASVESLHAYKQANRILFFMPFKGEVDISPLLSDALLRGCRCALPKCGSNQSLRLFDVTDLERDTAPGMWGIREPKDCLCECTGEEFSVIIVPGVAFDRQGRRIGYGAGYYDRLLGSDYAGVLKIAPAFALQVLPELPHGKYDIPVDVIVTEEEIINCRKAGEGYHG